ncbi:hypothetical protein OHB41_41660 [Streptomyces sp. NBC_01571]|uniref:hypothetical protein n=1 Tax=Streptomyces sp. NBC_01571 TaxID=2975883 RepID=UPI002251392B|nr:hypothetical protein [Streptomyces sp. NBC_01571]MCX4579582.1 hypothetical protein [Streptomyces sp. NBC_01571]
MTWRTVKQFAEVATSGELFTGQWQNRPSVLDDYKRYLDDRWNGGCTNAWKLEEEIVPLGYKGSFQRVRAYLHDKRTSPRPVTAMPPSPRPVSGWILRHPDTLAGPASTPSLRASTETATPSSPASPCPGTPASSKATSTGSRCSSARCSAAQASTFFANGSCSSRSRVVSA